MTSLDDIQASTESAYSAVYDMRDEVENMVNTITSAINVALRTLGNIDVDEDDPSQVETAIGEAIDVLEGLI